MKRIDKAINKLFLSDQRDRNSEKLRKLSDKERWEIIGERDRKRIDKLNNYLKKNKKLSGLDLFRAGIIMQHGGRLKYIRKANQLAKLSAEKGYKKAKWLYAASLDRSLMMQQKKQKFGTQYVKQKNGKWRVYPIAQGMSDRVRAEYNVKPLHQIKKIVGSLNRMDGSTRKVGLTIKKAH